MLSSLSRWKEFIGSESSDQQFTTLYGGGLDRQKKRYIKALEQFGRIFGDAAVALISAPGRTELGGNHTDHQRGRVLAAAVTLDSVAAAAPSDAGLIRVYAEGFGMYTVDIGELAPIASEEGSSAAMIRGVAARLGAMGRRIGGFDALITSDVPRGSGLSSSASFEILVCTILNHFYNNDEIPATEEALAGQYAENRYFGKPCGLMDQLTSASGGVVSIDFHDPDQPVLEKIPGALFENEYKMCIVNSGGSHADLTADYADIPKEMSAVAAFFGQEALGGVRRDDFYRDLDRLRGKLPDRALLRAMHFFAEDARAPLLAEALKKGDAGAYLRLMRESGASSFTRLQNIFPGADPAERGLSLALSLSEELLGDRGAWRVHGGGFAGTIQAMAPLPLLGGYRREMRRIFGNDCFYELALRPAGGHVMKTGDEVD